MTTTSASYVLEEPSFNGNAPILGFVLTCIPQAAYNVTSVVSKASTTSSVTITGLEPGAKYDCHFQVFNAIGVSGPSLSGTLEMFDEGIPSNMLHVTTLLWKRKKLPVTKSNSTPILASVLFGFYYMLLGQLLCSLIIEKANPALPIEICCCSE